MKECLCLSSAVQNKKPNKDEWKKERKNNKTECYYCCHSSFCVTGSGLITPSSEWPGGWSNWGLEPKISSELCGDSQSM